MLLMILVLLLIWITDHWNPQLLLIELLMISKDIFKCSVIKKIIKQNFVCPFLHWWFCNSIGRSLCKTQYEALLATNTTKDITNTDWQAYKHSTTNIKQVASILLIHYTWVWPPTHTPCVAWTSAAKAACHSSTGPLLFPSDSLKK